ncbi:tetratricopeptide repeat protein 6, partial [Biomphalaria glabrata]
MRKPKISLLGVLPVRACSDIQTLNVALEGASALEYTSVARAAPKLYNTPASSFVFADNSLGEINETKTKSDTQSAPRKPAILPGMGTTVLKLCERMKPIKISYLHQRKKSKRPKTKSPNMAASCQSSFSSTELNLSDDTTYTTNNETPEVLFAGESIETYIGLEKETERDELTSGNTVKSVKELLEEAKLISLATSEPLYIKNANRYISNKEEGLLEKNQMDKGNNTKRNPVKENTKISSQNQKEKTFSNVVDTVEIKRAERTVDEIIASLKDQTAYNQETDADRKIKEIMQRVMSRTNIEVEETFDETKTERNESSALITESDQEPDKQVSSLHYFDDAKLEIDDIPTADTGTYNSNDLMTDDPVSFGSKSIADRSPLSISELNFTKTDDNGIKESEILDEHLRQTREEINYEQMRNDLLLPPEATVEDLLSIKVPKSFNNDMDSRKTQEKQNHISVHHFCHNTPDSQLPLELVHVGRKYHTPDRFASVARAQRYRFRPGDVILSAECSSTDNSVRPNQESERINQATPMESSLTIWQKTAEKLLGETLIMVAGKMVDMGSNESQIYWNPAPPKLGTASDIVKEFLFPQYRVEGCEELFERHPVETMEKESNTNEDKGDTELDLEKKKLHERTVRKRHNSDNTKQNSRKKNKKVDKYDCISDAQSCNSINEDQLDTNEKEQTYRRPVTAPSLLATNYETLIIPQDFNTALHEIKEQKKLLEKVKQMKHKEVEKRNHQTLGEAPNVLLKKDSIKFEIKNASEKVKEEPTPCEEAIQAGRNYIILPKKKKKKKGKRTLDKSKMIAAEQMLTTKNTKFIERRESMPMQHKIIERELRVSWQIRHRRFSMPSVLNFQEYKTRKRMPSEENEREWVRGIWNTWFDEVFPPTPHGSDEEEVNKEIIDKKIKKDTKEENNQLKKEVSQILSQDIEAIEPMKDTMENTEIYQKEITKLTHVINNIQTPTAFDYCRRGALYRKIGQLKKAECDLDRAINMEPDLLDAYWHRHLLYILQDKKTAALEDLNFIMKRNKSHAGAYRSMAEIHKQQDDITMAIINYSSAIKYNSLDHEAYFQRAQLYEKRGDMLLAMEDYTNAIKIMPYHTDAIMKHGLYYFENENWGNAINDFSELLKVEPFNVKARIFRARAYAKMMNWVASLQDLSATIHLDPNNWQAFYQRACILRKANPEKALLDLSVSLLLNDTEENIMSYLQRGILYNTLGKPEDAIQDFESVLKLNKDIAPAHVNLGLIFMNRHCNYHRAIKTFTAALKVDPTYVRAYVCRAEAYYKIHEMKNALKDFTKAIHLCPDVHYHYMYRGHLVLKMGQLELAAFCVSHASELGIKNPEKSFGGSASQQAVVHSFLNNFDKAVEALQQAARAQPSASTFMLLGKTHMKARQYKEAASSFNDALDKMKPWKKGDSWPKEAAEAHYLSGLCYMELRKFSEAQLQFNQAIKLNSSYADAYYQQGLASVKLKHPKGIQDFNRALALNPKIFQ